MMSLLTLNAFIFYGLALAGILAHAVKKYLCHEIDYSVYAYLFTVDPRGTVWTVLSVLGGTVGLIGGGVIHDPNTFTDVSTVFLIGFTLDSAVLPANSRGNEQ